MRPDQSIPLHSFCPCFVWGIVPCFRPYFDLQYGLIYASQNHSQCIEWIIRVLLLASIFKYNETTGILYSAFCRNTWDSWKISLYNLGLYNGMLPLCVSESVVLPLYCFPKVWMSLSNSERNRVTLRHIYSIFGQRTWAQLSTGGRQIRLLRQEKMSLS